MPLIYFKKKTIVEAIAAILNYDPYWDSVVFLSHFNNSNVLDEKQSTLLTNSTTSTIDSKFGDTARQFTGTSEVTYNHPTNFQFPGDFTIEFWAKPSSYRAGSALSLYNFFFDFGAGELYFRYDEDSSFFQLVASQYIFTTASTPTLNVWHHYAFVRSNTTVKLFVDGQLMASGTKSGTIGSSNGNVRFGNYSGGGDRGFIGVMDEIRITKGIARYTSNFNVPTVAFPMGIELEYDWFWNNTILEIKGGNNDVATGDNSTFIDSSPNNLSIIRGGNVTQGTFSPFSTGGSAYFDGTNDYLSIASGHNSLAAGDFTIEAWVNFKALASGKQFLSGYSVNGFNWCLYFTSATDISLYLSGNGTSWNIANGVIIASSIAVDTWYHIAIVRANTSVKTYINGVRTSTVAINQAIYTNNQPIYLGGLTDGYSANCHISNFRLVRGSAVYTSDFTVPTSPLSAITYTDALLKFENGNIIDSSRTSNLEIVGSPYISTSVKKSGVGSIYLNGATDYVIIPANSLPSGTGDFTIEMYVNPTIRTSIILDNRPLGVNGAYCTISLGATGNLYWTVNGTSIIITSATLTSGTFNHIAFVRYSGVMIAFINGVIVGTSVDTTNYIANRGALGFNISFPGTPYWLQGYVDDMRVTNVARYTSNFTPKLSEFSSRAPMGLELTPTEYDPYWQQVILAMSMDSLIDGKNHTITTGGSAALNSTTKKFGQNSVYFGGTSNGGLLQITPTSDFALGTKDFTIEFWVNPSYAGVGGEYGKSIFDLRPSMTNGDYPGVGYSSGGDKKISFSINTAGFSSNDIVEINVWTHVAITRKNGLVNMFINGIKQANSATISTNALVGDVLIGANAFRSGAPTTYFNGYIDDVRVTKGIARYTSSFSVPTIANPTYGASF